ncbi:DUF5655 domain-containing protein [Saccharothrix australiensis]|uniref:DUF5655 domain-containing protein n=1 Tax=Saccharothrix australiensis TaxID=2072 RepID=A0A495W2U2_9PSEU|nr:DUF5655 domain-containing protein [Saccharothrix australiensis]RKT55972.1 hypothetical protein C8E97_4660 [Saccharothrix australiensis]
MPPAEHWREMVDWSACLLRRTTGEGVPEWNRRVLASGIDGERELRAWLDERAVTGYPQLLLLMERFGYPDFVWAGPDDPLAGAGDLVDRQYADRAELRPILDRVLAEAALLGPMRVRARKTHVALVSPRRTFAVVKAGTRTRVDLGLRLAGRAPGGRLEAAPSLGNGAITVRIALTSADAIDGETLSWLRDAYTGNR